MWSQTAIGTIVVPIATVTLGICPLTLSAGTTSRSALGKLELNGTGSDVGDWSRVSALRAGQDIVLIADGTGALPRLFVVADADGVIVMNPHSGSAGPFGNRFRDLAAHQATAVAALVSGSSTVVEDHGVSLRADGVFFGDQRVANLDDVVKRFDRRSVIQISVDGKTDRDKRGIALGFAGAAVMSFGALIKNPEGGPGAGFYLGLPLIVAAVAMTHGERSREGIIYRRPE